MKRLSKLFKRRSPALRALAIVSALLLCTGVRAQERSGFYVRDVTVKVNALTLPLLVVNAAVEVRPMEHWSVSLPVYYTALDWFSETVKFRVLAIQPELRYWLKGDMTGLFFNAHGTFGYYNMAWGGTYRYQDHARRSPSLGGGLGIGYKLPMDEGETPWGIEFGIGGGVVPLHYDYYYNVPNGRLAGSDTHTYFGLDQAFVSFTYRLGKSNQKEK